MMKIRKHTNRVLVHHSEGGEMSRATLLAMHKARGFDDIGYQIIIHKDGRMERGRPIDTVGAHAYGRNHDSIGILLFGDFLRYEPELEQLNTFAKEYHALCRFYGKTLALGFHTGLKRPWLWGKKIPCPGPKLDRPGFLEEMYRNSPYAIQDNTV